MYIESTDSETDDEFSSGFQCRLLSLATRPATMVAQTATLVDGVLLLDYDAVEGIQTDEEVDGM